VTETPLIPTPAEMLVGRQLGDWTVIERIVRPPLATGGNFSVGYVVESDRGRRGFLKALDFSDAFEQPDFNEAVNQLTWAFIHERDLLRDCARMSRVVTALDHGAVRDPDWSFPVSYLIFEWADQDSRTYVDTAEQFDIALRLRALHHASVGLQQLHSGQIVHQDMKPSNLLIFNGIGSKVADLGRSAHRSTSGPFDDFDCPGDRTYAPPEILYRAGSNDWEGRLASDMYQLGSLAMFFFTGLGMTSALLARLDRKVAPQEWRGSYSGAMPFVQQAFADSIDTMANQTPSKIRVQLTRIVKELTHPDPERRGHPRNRIGYQNKYGLQRYVSSFNLLAGKAEYKLRQGLQ